MFVTPLDIFSVRSASVAAVILFSGLSTGCTASATRQPVSVPEKQRAYIAEPCATLKQQGAEAVPVGMVLEVADVAEPLGVPVKDWLAAHSIEVHHVAKISVPMTVGAVVRSPFGACLDRTCSEAEDGALEVTVAKVPTDVSKQVELQLDFTSKSGGPRRLSVKATNQEPVLEALAGPSDQTVVITPYYLFEPKQHSLDLLLQCASSGKGKEAP
jgi:hypothetical protein